MDNHQIKSAVTFLRAAGQRERLKILGELARQATSLPALARQTGLKETAVLKHIGRLRQAGLVEVTAPFTYRLDEKALNRLSQTVFQRDAAAGKESFQQRVLRHYTDGPRLKRLPDNEDELIAILQWLAQRFHTATAYPEKEVNALVNQAHPDHATLRRLLVDYGFLTRHRGIYAKRDQTNEPGTV